MANRWTTSATSRRVVPDRKPVSVTRGFTILELLVTLGILLAVGGILIPFTLAELERRELVLAEDQLGMLVQFARVESRRSGAPVEVVIDADGRNVEVLRLDPKSLGDGVFVDAEDAGVAVDFEDVVEVDESASDRRLPSRWARRALPEIASLRPPPSIDSELAGFRPEDAFGGFDLDSPTSAVESAFDSPWPGPTRLAVAFPDGSVVTVTPAVLVSSGRLRSWEIDPWNGRSRFGPFTNPIPEESIEFEEDVEDELSIDQFDLNPELDFGAPS